VQRRDDELQSMALQLRNETSDITESAEEIDRICNSVNLQLEAGPNKQEITDALAELGEKISATEEKLTELESMIETANEFIGEIDSRPEGTSADFQKDIADITMALTDAAASMATSKESINKTKTAIDSIRAETDLQQCQQAYLLLLVGLHRRTERTRTIREALLKSHDENGNASHLRPGPGPGSGSGSGSAS
jgi:hypothetical protein